MELSKLSARGRRSLEGRLRQLDEERIPRLENELAEADDPVIEASLRSARSEATRLRNALSSATPLEDEPHDPTVVELGDTVTVREDASNELERFTVVGDLEARLDMTWISVKSPLGGTGSESEAAPRSRPSRSCGAKQRVIPTSPLVWSLWEVLHLDKRLVRSRKLPHDPSVGDLVCHGSSPDRHRHPVPPSSSKLRTSATSLRASSSR